MSIKQNVEGILERMNDAAVKSGRSLEDITLVAVTKFASVEQIRQVIDLGIYNLGENKAQSMLSKYDQIDSKARWNFIGHLQTNKVKSIIEKVSLIHSVDRLSLAQEIQKCASHANIVMPCLLQVNIAKEESKSGVYEEDLFQFYQQVKEFPNIAVKGLMAIMPLEDPELVRPYFRKMKEYYCRIQDEFHEEGMEYLSMGMSNDYIPAIEEGSNMVRIGTAIFKEM